MYSDERISAAGSRRGACPSALAVWCPASGPPGLRLLHGRQHVLRRNAGHAVRLNRILASRGTRQPDHRGFRPGLLSPGGLPRRCPPRETVRADGPGETEGNQAVLCRYLPQERHMIIVRRETLRPSRSGTRDTDLHRAAPQQHSRQPRPCVQSFARTRFRTETGTLPCSPPSASMMAMDHATCVTSLPCLASSSVE